MVITMTLKPLLPVSALLAMTLALTGCFDSDKKKDEKPVSIRGLNVIQSVGSGESMLEFTNGMDQVISGFHSKTATDYAVFARGDYFYHVGRFNIDTIQKYHIDNPTLGYYPNDGFSLRSDGNASSANPYNMGFLDDNTAVITRYGSATAWVVNLAANQAGDFLLQELDLSEFTSGEGDTVPEMDMVFIHNGKAFITLQNLTNWNSTGNERIVVIDTNTWEIIDTNPAAEGVQAIELSLANHQSGVQVGNQIYLGAVVYDRSGTNHSGGIERINLDTYSTTTLISDLAINRMTATENGTVFFTSYEDWQVNTLYKLSNNTALKVSDDLSALNLSALAAQGEVLWLGTATETNNIYRLDANADFSSPKALSDITLSMVETAFKPIGIAFMQIEETQLDIEVPEDNTEGNVDNNTEQNVIN